MNKASALLKKILILALILALPGFLYYLLTVGGKNRYKPLPVFGPKVIAKTGHKFHSKYIPDTIFHHLPAFVLINQNGDTVTNKTFTTKIFIAGFFYTHCPQVCAQINSNLDSLVKGYARNKMLRFVSITIDPKNDTPAALKKYAQKFEMTAKWQFLTGDPAMINNLAVNGFYLNAVHLPTGDFVMDDKLVLIDQEQRIRGYYHGTSIPDMNRLNDEIKVLIAEELRKIKAPEM